MTPEQVTAMFRTVAIERIDRIEAAWAQVLATLAEEPSTIVHREIHTLKGEASMAGFADVATLCHRIEDLIEIARARGYAIEEDFDLAFNMALQFLVMLVRQTEDEPNTMDLAGYLRHLDKLLKRHDQSGRTRPGSVPPALRPVLPGRFTAEQREHMGPVAVDAYIEYAVSAGPRRDRLRKSWHLLRDLIGIQRAVISTTQLAKYKSSMHALAGELGKSVEISFELGSAEITAEILTAIDTALLHLLRNAVDHGIESPATRLAAGKPSTGSIRIHGGVQERELVIAVEDDGAGIDHNRVQARAVELGLIAPGEVVERDRLIDVLCRPGFSTRAEASNVSGRGVGLDAVRGSIVDLGGWLTARSEEGRGTTWTMTFPIPELCAPGYVLRAPGLRLPVVLGQPWHPMTRPPEMPIVVDIAAALGLSPSNSISSTIWWFTNGQLEVGFVAGGKPTPVDARRLIATPPTALAEVITIDSVEGLLVRPEQIPGVAPPA